MVYTAEKSDDQYDYREPLPSSILPLCPEVGLVFVNPCIEIPILDVESRSIRNVILDIAKKTAPCLDNSVNGLLEGILLKFTCSVARKPYLVDESLSLFRGYFIRRFVGKVFLFLKVSENGYRAGGRADPGYEVLVPGVRIDLIKPCSGRGWLASSVSVQTL